MLEATLIVNINDSLEDVEELASFSKVIVDKVPGCTLVVNLIPFNDIDHPLYETPTLDISATSLFSWDISHICTTRGNDESTACGQLATTNRRT